MKNNNQFPIKMILAYGLLLLAASAAIGAVAGLLVWKEWIPMGTAKLARAAAVFVLIYGAGWSMVKKAGKGRMQLALCLAAVYETGCFLAGVLAYPGLQYQFGYEMLLPFAAAVLAAFTATTPRAYRR